jgi:hypothetical protein
VMQMYCWWKEWSCWFWLFELVREGSVEPEHAAVVPDRSLAMVGYRHIQLASQGMPAVLAGCHWLVMTRFTVPVVLLGGQTHSCRVVVNEVAGSGETHCN